MAAPKKTKVYCAGPMFSNADKWEMQNISDALEAAGFDTYLPQRDGIEMGSIMAMGNNPSAPPVSPAKIAELTLDLQQAIFSLDVYQLVSCCDAVVFNMDGRVPDGGSVAEIAVAFAAGKPTLIYKNDPITLMNGADNPMILGLGYTWRTTADVSQIPIDLKALLEQFEKDFGSAPPPTFNAHIQSVLAMGEAVQKLLPVPNTPAGAIKLIVEIIALAKQFPRWDPLPPKTTAPLMDSGWKTIRA